MKTLFVNSNLIPPEYRNAAKWPEKFTCSFIEPGLISYEDMDAGKVLVTKNALDKMAQSFIGKPVVNLMHKDLEPKDFKKADGVVTNVYYNDTDGWYYCDFLVWDEDTKKNCAGGKFSVSCAYIPTDTDTAGGMHNNIKYDQEVRNGEYTHLAIVKNPRYNRARILLNSIGGTMFKLWPFGKKEAPKDVKHNELDTEAALIDVDGVQVPLQELIECYKAEKAEAAPKPPADAPVEAKPLDVGDESMIPVGEEEVKLKELVHSYKAKLAKKNAADEAEAKKKADEEAEAKAKKEKENAETPEAKKEREEAEAKAAEEKKNAEEADAKKKAEDEEAKAKQEKENSIQFKRLQNAALRRNHIEPTEVHTRESKREAGKSRYGRVVSQ